MEGLKFKIKTNLQKMDKNKVPLKDLQRADKNKIQLKSLRKLDKSKVQGPSHSNENISPDEFARQLAELDIAREVCKNIEISEDSRKRGNHSFNKKKHEFETHFKILHLYNKSIAFAPSKSEQLALAYANRSALLRHIRKYEESICEADKALDITKSSLLRVKLFCRKADCYTALGSPKNRACLEKARFSLTKSEDSEETLKLMSDLITKTQEIVDANKLDKPKEDKRKIEAMKMAADAEKNNVWESVKIECSVKHEKYLVATRDFEPGEIIFVEKPYFNCVHESMVYLYCAYCFDYLWTVVPCDQCAWRLYCSENCKNEAWDQYHDKECAVLMKMKANCMLEGYCMIPLVLGIFFKALKEAGDIGQLQSELKKIDACRDECKKGFSPDGKFEGYKSIYALPLRQNDMKNFEYYANDATIVLTALAKYSDIFGKNYNYNEMKKLWRNNAAIFVGALLLKLYLVVNSRTTRVNLHDPADSNVSWDKYATNPKTSTVIKSLGYLNIFDCAPNADYCATYGNRSVTYALIPIKKGTPLTTALCSIYDSHPKSKRQEVYSEMYDRACKCQACSENWLENGGSVNRAKEYKSPDLLAAMRFGEEICWVSDELKTKANKLNHPDIKLLSTAKNVVADSFKFYEIPSTVIINAINLMRSAFHKFFFHMKLDPEKTSMCAN